MYAYIKVGEKYEIHLRQLYGTELPSFLFEVEDEKLAEDICYALCTSYNLGYEKGINEVPYEDDDDQVKQQFD